MAILHEQLMEKLIRRYGAVQLATLVDAPPQGDKWLHEIKFDGYRLLAFLEDDEVKLFTRNGNDWTVRFPSIRVSVAELKARSAVLDMEAVIVEKSGRTSFHALQQALGEGGDTAAIVGYVFDVLHLNGEDQSRKPQNSAVMFQYYWLGGAISEYLQHLLCF